ncbi:hypothetical protein [Sporosarcina sp. YIM B06819]|nr:hypothetical protein [Sporosarcina sp. YIM B06819]
MKKKPVIQQLGEVDSTPVISTKITTKRIGNFDVHFSSFQREKPIKPGR